MSKRGKTLRSSTRELIFNIIQFCQREKSAKHTIIDLNKVTERVAAMSCLSRDTISKIKKEGSTNNGVWCTPGKKRKGRPNKVILDDFDKCVIRNKIREFYAVRKEVPTLRKLHRVLKEDINFCGGITSLRGVLKELGYRYKKCESKRKVLIERHDIVVWRAKYLRIMKHLRATGKPVVYIDETYIHTAHEVSKCWQGPNEPGVSKAISLGERYIIVHAGSREGFIENCLLAYKTKSISADYHHDMNRDNFTKWTKEKLLPNLSQPSVIVLDNASYHSTRINKPPNSNDRKETLKKWLEDNGIEYPVDALKAELVSLVKRNKGEPVFEIDQLLEEHGHTVVRLPPYHCDLNAIEMIWSLAKRQVASKNVNISAKELLPIINECFRTITAEHWRKECDHVIHVEQKYWEQDRLMEDMQEFIINVTDSSTSSSEEDNSLDLSGSSKQSSTVSGIQYLESDFDYDSDHGASE
ncbi:uncharacterized protein LOC126378115 [Pectinophora gossypiella]|uniref:uncharacterized protein LOC126366278 n=1 Tax=Pectinophora gossypiella TaxID=13191 RepID=UPI00214EEE65|nr:uncharacterized protein LOC126366278 [Pectinophora gossypiella]XP_049882251.1 uncharacterized protein LOC126378115 [Pectinophora gossypiella]